MGDKTGGDWVESTAALFSLIYRIINGAFGLFFPSGKPLFTVQFLFQNNFGEDRLWRRTVPLSTHLLQHVKVFVFFRPRSLPFSSLNPE